MSSAKGKGLWPSWFLRDSDTDLEGYETCYIPRNDDNLLDVICINDKEIVFVYEKAFHVYNTEQRCYEHSERIDSFIRQCVLFEKERLLVLGHRNVLHVWDISSRKFLCKWKDFPGAASVNVCLAVPTLSNHRYFIIGSEGKIHRVQLENDEGGGVKPQIVSTLRLPGPLSEEYRDIYNIVSGGENVAIEMGQKVIVQNLTSGKLPKIKAELSGRLKSISISNKHLCLTLSGLYKSQIVVKDLKSMKTVAQSPPTGASTGFTLPSEENSGTIEYYTCSLQNDILCTNVAFRVIGQSGHYYVYVISSIKTKQVLFKYSTSYKLRVPMFTTFFFTPKIQPNGIVLLDKDEYFKLFRLPQHIIHAALGDTSSSSLAAKHPENLIKDAYLSCIQHNSTLDAAQLCTDLITFDRCKLSFSEYFYAHRLLMLAVHDGKIEPSTTHDGKLWKWFEDIYLAGKEFPLQSEPERNALRKILHEAQTVGVITDGSVIIAVHDVVQELRTTCSAIIDIGHEIFERLVRLEQGHQSLKEAFERYKHVQGMTALLGVALNVIPFVGGSVTAAISAGTQVFEGLALGEFVKFGLESANDTILTSETLETLLVRYAGVHLSKEQIDKLGTEQRNNLIQHLHQSGTSPEMLHFIFMRAVDGDYVNPAHIMPSDIVQVEEIIEDEGKKQSGSAENESSEDYRTDVTQDEEIYDGQSIDGTQQHKNSQTKAMPSVQGASSSSISATPTKSTLTFEMKELEERNLDKESVKRLKSGELSAVIAAFMCGYDNSRVERFNELSFAFHDYLQNKNITGLVISDRVMFPEQSVAKSIMEFMTDKYSSLLTDDEFFEGKLVAFLRTFSV